MLTLHIPRSRLREQAVRDAFHQQLDDAGRIYAEASIELDEQAQSADADASRCVSGVANVQSVSRSQLCIHIDGLDIEHYNRVNPVVLAAHEQCSRGLLPGAIGVVERVYKVKQQLRFRNMRFDDDPIADAWYQKVRKRIVRMVSVGFLPLEWELARKTVGRGERKREITYIDIPQSELLEISVVPVGANRGAVIGQRSAAYLLERLEQVEQTGRRLQQAVDAFLDAERRAASSAAQSRLMQAVNSFATDMEAE